MKKEQKNPVGRPKLADSKTKKESLLICLFVLVVIVIVGIIGYNTLAINFDPKYNVANVYNSNVNKCSVENDKITCGNNVTYMKYKLNKGDYKEISKEDVNISVSVDENDLDNVCYKTNTTDLKCIK